VAFDEAVFKLAPGAGPYHG
jgi:ATP-binding cassette, subfamily A (ABC1), member 3